MPNSFSSQTCTCEPGFSLSDCVSDSNLTAAIAASVLTALFIFTISAFILVVYLWYRRKHSITQNQPKRPPINYVNQDLYYNQYSSSENHGPIYETIRDYDYPEVVGASQDQEQEQTNTLTSVLETNLAYNIAGSMVFNSAYDTSTADALYPDQQLESADEVPSPLSRTLPAPLTHSTPHTTTKGRKLSDFEESCILDKMVSL